MIADGLWFAHPSSVGAGCSECLQITCVIPLSERLSVFESVGLSWLMVLECSHASEADDSRAVLAMISVSS